MKKTITILGLCLLLVLNGLHAQINVRKGEGGLWIFDGKNKVAFYQKEEISMNLESGRANFLHPVYLPDGTVVTENAPADHVHHRGVFWAWHQILIDGKSMGDSWALKDIGIDVKSVEFKRVSQEKGQLETISFWESPAWKNGQEAFLEEITSYTFFQQNGNYRKIKIDIQLKSLVDGLQLGGSDDEKGYGGFSVRMKLPDDIRFISEKGPVEPVVTAVEAGQYMNMTGSVGKNGNAGGIIIYADPRNQSTPQTWILRDKMSMQNAVFPGRKPIGLKKDVPLKLTYMLILYSGKINMNRIIKEI
ncbi:MAG: DUF6807 family protein [Prolixibacteraceae bacterium]